MHYLVNADAWIGVGKKKEIGRAVEKGVGSRFNSRFFLILKGRNDSRPLFQRAPHEAGLARSAPLRAFRKIEVVGLKFVFGSTRRDNRVGSAERLPFLLSAYSILTPRQSIALVVRRFLAERRTLTSPP